MTPIDSYSLHMAMLISASLRYFLAVAEEAHAGAAGHSPTSPANRFACWNEELGRDSCSQPASRGRNLPKAVARCWKMPANILALVDQAGLQEAVG